MISAYYRLTKPGIVYGNLLPAIGAFFFGSPGLPHWPSLLFMVGGLACIIACGCVLNNYFDRSMDARMERTKHRALVTGAIPPSAALLFALVLGLSGTALLHLFSTPVALVSALLGLFVYVALYTPLKSRSATALYVGAVAGAMPPVVGYAAAAGTLDAYAAGLFLALYLWQLPHFIAIAFFRYEEYRAAGVPLLIKTPPSPEARKVARKIFHYSLWVLLLGCAGLIVQTWMR